MPRSRNKVTHKSRSTDGDESENTTSQFKSVVAVVIGIENYQNRSNGQVPVVHYAQNDAQKFAETLRALFGESLELQLLIDSDATATRVRDELGYIIRGLRSGALFIFYYAGHGFHGDTGNRITAWDTNPFNIPGTTLAIREVLLDPLMNSECKKSLLFIDACAAGFRDVVASRDILADMDQTELNSFLQSADYSALFLSCSPKEKSYPSDDHKHGVWTHFVLEALNGRDERAMSKDRIVTDQTLRDYLRTVVPEFVTKRLSVPGTQTPYAIINATNTFSIRAFPRPTVIPDANLGWLKPLVKSQFFEGVSEGKIRLLSGYDRKKHFIPKKANDATSAFVASLLASKIDEEVEEFQATAKEVFELSRRDLTYSSVDGNGNIDTPAFRFSIKAKQHPTDVEDYQIVRKLNPRKAAALEKIDEVFGSTFKTVVLLIDASSLSFDEVANRLDDTAKGTGSRVEEEMSENKITFVLESGSRAEIDIARGRITFSDGMIRGCLALGALPTNFGF